ncbi:hypothetical protein F5X68DRAFT_241042, partial [Plectosphaerella plurivora]
LCLQFLLLPFQVFAGFEESLVAFESSAGAIELHNAIIIRDDSDPVGISIAANTLADDFEQITGSKPLVKAWTGTYGNGTTTNSTSGSPVAIIAGTVDSPLIRRLERAGKIDVDDIRGKWETLRTSVVANPLAGVGDALVIAGSDMRAVVFGLYTLSEQSGQSPLHWWADVPATKHDSIYALNKTFTFGEPTVKFRGLFINDEAPALTGWWAERSNRTDYTFDAEFYERVFDLLLRLRANFIWPAMWASFVPSPGRIFFTDDPENIQLANDYGIVVSTSHHEPMQRASNEWTKTPNAGPWNWVTNKDNVVEFMDQGVQRAALNDTYFTLGMRGENDGPIQADDPIAVLEDVFATERELLAKHYGNETAAKQVWTIYKEVATYYAAGLTPPDDVTLMFTDDNWGNVQRLPNEEERKRSGGIGPKVYKELFQAAEGGATQIWVMNVGDIKPLELPLNLAMDLAWNSTRFDLDTLPQYLESLAARDFGPDQAEAISSAWLKYSHLVGLRHFEVTEPTTYSLANYEEANRVLDAWKTLSEDARVIEAALPENQRAALFHTLTYGAVAGHNYHEIVLGQAKNSQYSFERRNSANDIAHRLIDSFDFDYDLLEDYDSLSGGKWKGIMSTPKFDMNAADWRPSSRDVMANLSFVQLRQDFDYGFGNLGIFVEQSRAAYLQGRICASINPSKPTKDGFSPRMRVMEPHGPETRFIDLFHRGDSRKTLTWSIEVPEPWIKLSESTGQVSGSEPEQRVLVSIDWAAVPANFNKVLQLRVSYGPPDHWDYVHLPIWNKKAPDGFVGFPDVDGIISIEAPHFQRSSTGDVQFQKMPRLGSRSESGSVGLRPYTDAHESEKASKASWLEYDIFVLGDSPRSGVNATIYVNGALDTHPDKPMTYSLTLKDAESKFVRVLGEPTNPGDNPPEWTAEVASHVWKRTVPLGTLAPGKHTLRWQVNSPEVYLEKIVVATQGRLPDTYLGPPETRLL